MKLNRKPYFEIIIVGFIVLAMCVWVIFFYSRSQQDSTDAFYARYLHVLSLRPQDSEFKLLLSSFLTDDKINKREREQVYEYIKRVSKDDADLLYSAKLNTSIVNPKQALRSALELPAD